MITDMNTPTRIPTHTVPMATTMNTRPAMARLILIRMSTAIPTSMIQAITTRTRIAG